MLRGPAWQVCPWPPAQGFTAVSRGPLKAGVLNGLLPRGVALCTSVLQGSNAPVSPLTFVKQNRRLFPVTGTQHLCRRERGSSVGRGLVAAVLGQHQESAGLHVLFRGSRGGDPPSLFQVWGGSPPSRGFCALLTPPIATDSFLGLPS